MMNRETEKQDVLSALDEARRAKTVASLMEDPTRKELAQQMAESALKNLMGKLGNASAGSLGLAMERQGLGD